MKRLEIGQKVNVGKTIPGQFYTKGVGVLKGIENGVATITLTTGRGLFGQFHRSTQKTVEVVARAFHVTPFGEAS